MEEASRFGILNTNPDGSIYEFDEKPKVPKSTKASMGIYVFSWNKLKEYLIADEKDKSSSNDFGKTYCPPCSMRVSVCSPMSSRVTGRM